MGPVGVLGDIVVRPIFVVRSVINNTTLTIIISTIVIAMDIVFRIGMLLDIHPHL